MGGTNPYIKTASAEKPSQTFEIEFLPEGRTVTVLPNEIPTSGTGLPGSVLDIALAVGIDIDHACGGVCACSTCHIILKEGFDSCNEVTDEENDQLEKAPGLKATSRLACQAVPNGKSKLVVQVPNWNRNLARE